MKERPILFAGPMVRAVLERRKTQTRRLVRWPEWVSESDRHKLACQHPATGLAEYEDGEPRRRMTCPYGAPGDRLWVRETWAAMGNEDGHPIDKDKNLVKWGPGVHVVHRADTTPGPYGADILPDGREWFNRWRPSIHMPRWASRLLLEVTDVRVERLQDITETDARAEGFDGLSDIDPLGDGIPTTARIEFKEAWSHINGKRADWDSNPWVWVVAFRVADDEP